MRPGSEDRRIQMIAIDGSMGEGGGQVLRSSLSLSLVTGKPFRIDKIRAGRKKPGLLRQHLTAVTAAGEISNASIKGAEMGSESLSFEPGPVKGGEYSFAVGTAGSATLVLQTILPALLTAKEESHLTLEGGTHNPWAPPFDFLEKSFLPLINRMGPKVEVSLERYGFYPAGGGKFTVEVKPAGKLKPVQLKERGDIKHKKARAIVASLPENICHRELKVIDEKLQLGREGLCFEQVDSPGPGNVVIVEIACENITEVFTGFGMHGVSAEAVARDTAKDTRRYLASEAPVGPHLADQLLIPLAMAGGGCFVTSRPSRHTDTNIEVIGKFLDVGFEVEEVGEDACEIKVT
jgi:RNA 3'-terminal phosphate cyclase (ATP)